MSKKVNLAVFIMSVLALSAVARAQSSSVERVEPAVIYLDAEEARFLKVINQFRSRLGLNELTVHAGLQIAAVKHSRWMAEQDRATQQDALSHFGPTPTTEFSDRIEQEGYSQYSTIGENVACGNGAAVDTFKQFAFSPSHLSNMMSPRYRHVGIGRAGNGSESCPFYWTNDFGSKSGPSTDLPPVTDIERIASAIDFATGEHSASGQTAARLLVMPTPAEEVRAAVQCVVPYRLGKGVLAYAVDTHTTLELNPGNEGYLMKISYRQENTDARFVSYSVSGVAVVQSAFYPLLTVFSASNSRVGGFMIQIDVPTGRAQFDPYPGRGGASGPISCKVR